jgi:hypothetical protein
LGGALLFSLLSCSSGDNHLYINYLVPLKVPSLKGQRLEILVHDKHSRFGVSGKQEGTEARQTIDNYALFVRRQGTHQVERVGEYDLAGLFHAAFTKRAQYLGADVLDDERTGTPLLVITIEQFSLELQESRWQAFIQYTGALKQNQAKVAEETVQGQADRKYVLGRADANRLMGDLFTRVVNQLDIGSFFQKIPSDKG